jgi:hypothetical protein
MFVVMVMMIMVMMMMVMMMITTINYTIGVTKSISHMQCKYQKHELNTNSQISITHTIKIQL